MNKQRFVKVINQLIDAFQEVLHFLGVSQSTKPKERSIIPYKSQVRSPSKADSRVTVITVHQLEYQQDELRNAQIYRNTPYPKIKRINSTNEPHASRESV